jgi:hypothetical protein
LDVSRTTVERALAQLERDRLLRRLNRRYAPYVPTVQIAKSAMVGVYQALCESCGAVGSVDKHDIGRPRRPAKRDPARREHLVHARQIQTCLDADVVATAAETLFRKAAARSQGSQERSIEEDLTLLARLRRREGDVLDDVQRETARLMRYFYAARYDEFLRGLAHYTARRVERADLLIAALVTWQQAE